MQQQNIPTWDEIIEMARFIIDNGRDDVAEKVILLAPHVKSVMKEVGLDDTIIRQEFAAQLHAKIENIQKLREFFERRVEPVREQTLREVLTVFPDIQKYGFEPTEWEHKTMGWPWRGDETDNVPPVESIIFTHPNHEWLGVKVERLGDGWKIYALDGRIASSVTSAVKDAILSRARAKKEETEYEQQIAAEERRERTIAQRRDEWAREQDPREWAFRAARSVWGGETVEEKLEAITEALLAAAYAIMERNQN